MSRVKERMKSRGVELIVGRVQTEKRGKTSPRYAFISARLFCLLLYSGQSGVERHSADVRQMVQGGGRTLVVTSSLFYKETQV